MQGGLGVGPVCDGRQSEAAARLQCRHGAGFQAWPTAGRLRNSSRYGLRENEKKSRVSCGATRSCDGDAVVMAHVVMAHVGMALVVMAHVVMAHAVMAHVVVAYTGRPYIVMALYSYRPI